MATTRPSGRPAVVTDLGGGVHQVTLPLPWALDHVHCYAVEDPDGWTVVDAGLGTPGTLRRWQEALRGLGSPAVRRLVVTHYHPDHLGGSAQLAEALGVEEVVQGRRDRALTEEAWLAADDGALAEFLQGHGMPAEEAAGSAADEGDLPVTPVDPTRLVDEGDVVEMAGEPFRVLVLPGHADGHIALLGDRSGRLLGGDVILQGITPNVGRWPDTAPDPLGRFLATLERLTAIAPRVVYPGHREVIDDVPTRAREIAAHHAERLDVALGALRDGARTAYDVGAVIWGGRLGFHERRFALVEAISHLDRLVGEGRAAEVEPGRWTPTG